MDSLKVKLTFPSSVFDTRFILKLVIFSGDDLSLSSWWRILALKLSVSGIMGLVSYMATDAKRAMSQNIFGLSLFSCLSGIILLCLNPEVRRFA